MIRERFKIGAMLAAIGAAFRVKQAQQILTPEAPDHDEFHHARSRGNYSASEKHRSRMKAKRRVRNEMAFQSRKRNRAV